MSSRMEIPAPHSFTHKRPSATIPSGRKVAGAPTTIETGVPCMFSPGGTLVEGTVFGTVEIMRDTLFVEAVNDSGNTRVIRAGDLLIDEDTDEVWRATGPGNTYQNPSLFSAGSTTPHHIEVAVERADPEGLVLA